MDPAGNSDLIFGYQYFLTIVRFFILLICGNLYNLALVMCLLLQNRRNLFKSGIYYGRVDLNKSGLGRVEDA